MRQGHQDLEMRLGHRLLDQVVEVPVVAGRRLNCASVFGRDIASRPGYLVQDAKLQTSHAFYKHMRHMLLRLLSKSHAREEAMFCLPPGGQQNPAKNRRTGR